MTRRLRTWPALGLALGLAGLLAVVGAIGLATPAQAAACTGTSGVTVVVDFAATGGGVVTRCAPGDPSSGLDALTAAGFTFTQVQTQPGFVCQIDRKPSSTCVKTPPASAYWSYWHAARGGSWSYSQTGAGSYDPKPGSVEGWAFGAGGKPGVSPPAPSAPKPSASSTTTRPSGGSTTRTSGTGGSRATGGSGGAAGTSSGGRTASSGGASSAGPGTSATSVAGSARTTAPTGASSSPRAGSSSSTATSGAGGSETSATPDALDGSSPASSSAAGSGISLVVGVLLLAVMGAAGLVVARRRRRLDG